MKTQRLFLLTSFILMILFSLFTHTSAQPTGSPCPTCPAFQPRWTSSGQVSVSNQAEKPPDDLPPEAYLLYKSAEEDWKAKKWEKAVEKYKSITKDYPSTLLAALSHMKIGLYQKYKNKWDEAIDEFSQGISIIPGTREAHDAKTSIACIHASRGEYDQALNLIREVLGETRDWDQVKYCSYWIKKLNRLKDAKEKGKLSSCGPKALAFLLEHKGIELKEEDIVKSFLTGPYLISMEGLRKVAEAKGVHASGMRVALDQLNKMELPVIALVDPGHYIIILSGDEKSFKMIDPESGERLFTIYREALEKVWTGYVLAFGERDILAKKGFLLLTQAEMESIRGGACICCPTGELGGSEDNPNTIFDRIERPIKGCNSTKKGMPGLLVNTYNLNLVVEDIDLSYAGLGPKVEIKRTYNSDDPREGVFGRSWTFNYNVSLYETPSETVQIRRGSGRNQTFTPLGNGTYQPPVSVYDELTKNPDGTFSLWIKKERLTQNFDTNGRLTSIVDQNGNAITFQYEANLSLVWGSYGSGNGQFIYPRGVAVDSSGYIYASDDNHRIQKFDGNGNFITKWGTYGSGDGQFNGPFGVAIDQSGHVYVVDKNNHRIQKFDSNGNFITKWGTYGSGDGQFNIPTAVAVDRLGYVYVVEAYNHRLQKFDSNGTFITKWGSEGSGNGEFGWPYGVAVDQSDHVYVSDATYNQIQKFTSTGAFITKWGSYGGGNGQFYEPMGIAVDQSGYVYVADSQNDRIQKFDSNGTFVTKWGTYDDHQFDYPNGVAVDQQGYLYVADTINHRMQKFLRNLPLGSFLASLTDAAGRATTFSYYEEDWRVSAITDPIGRQATFTYDSEGHLISQTDMAGITTTYTYDANSYMASISTPSGATIITHTYNFLYGHWLDSVTDPLGNARHYSYCGYPPYECSYMGQFDTGVRDARGNWITYHYRDNIYAEIDRFRDALGHETSFGYDTNHNRNSITDANGHTTRLIYDNYGNITSITDPWCYDHGCNTTYTYDDRDNLRQVKNPLNKTFLYDYDGNNNLRFITDPMNYRTEFIYNSLGQLTDTIDARTNRTTFTYDQHGNMATITDPLNLTTIYGYDGVSRLTSITDPGGKTTNYQYDGIDRITLITRPDTKTVQYTYSCCGPSTVKDENDQVTSYAYDIVNRLIKVTDPRGSEIRYEYDPNGNVLRLIDHEGQITSYIYDAINRPVFVTYPERSSGTSEQYVYDGVGNKTEKTDGKGVMTTYEYDANNRLTLISAPDLSISYGYDNAGNRTSMTDATGATTSNYDDLNRLFYVIYPDGKRIDYDYDEVGNQTTITTTFGTVTYGYDDSNRLSSLTLPNTQVVNYQYYPQGHTSAGTLQRIDYPNGTYSTYTYDTRNRLLNLYNGRPGGVISQYTYTLDGVGDRTNISFEEPLAKTNPSGTVNSSYLHGNLLKSSGTTTYTYDGNGNLATKTQGSNVTNYTFDSQDRLTQVSSPSLNMQYQYNGLFNRVSKTVSGTTTKFLVDPNGFLPHAIAEMDGAGNIISYFVYDGMGLVAKMTSQSVHFYHYDGVGTTVAMTDSNANMVNKYAYDEFGNLLNAVEAVSNPFLYVGKYGVMDEDNGLLYMRARYYDPQVGRFINKDPIRFSEGDFNLYTYVQNNPGNRVDPLGQSALPIPLPVICIANPALCIGLGAITIGVAIYYYYYYHPLKVPCKNEQSEKERCHQVWEDCIEKCSEILPTPRRDQGNPFFNCVNACLADNDCLGKL